MFRYLIAGLFYFLANTAHAADGDVTWFYQSFTDVSAVMASDASPQSVIAQLCRVKANKDLTNATMPSNVAGDTAFGHNLAGLASAGKVDDTMWQCVYGSATPGDDSLYFLHVFAEQKCDEGSEYDRQTKTCVKTVQCEEGQTVLLSGISASVVQTAPNTVYIADQTPDTACKKLDSSSIACSYKKPAYSHSCYSDSPLSWDANGNMTSTGTGHCNYQFVNSGDKCTVTSTNTLPEGWGGYSLTASSSDEFTCADGISSPGCPDGSAGDGSGSGNDGTGGGSGGSGGSTGGTGDGDTGSGGSDGGGSDTGSGGSNTGSSSSASGTACSASLVCTGDAVQCAILAQQKKAACGIADLTSVDQAVLASMFTGDKFQLEEKTVEATSLFDRARFLPSACPAPQSMSLSYGTFTIPYDFLCDFTEKFSYLLVLIATFVAMLIVFKD